MVWIETKLFFLPGVDASHVYVRAWRYVADRVAGQLRGDKECPFSGVTKSGRVWRKVPESGARSVGSSMSISTAIPVPCLNIDNVA